ncbi:MAG TPA: AAA family ATPase [Candidatus Bathyarchaeia archaeon]|nr:AAA family ATPase [Candidatus Bathyarchaeia archaeon]
MIVVTEDSPRWLRELAKFANLKNLLFVYGNVHDLVSFPIQTDTAEKVRWTDSDLGGFFRRFLAGMNYEIVGWVDPVEDLSFSTPEMGDLFHRVETGKPVKAPNDAKQQPGADVDHDAKSLPRSEKGGLFGRRSVEPPDLDKTIYRITQVLQNTQVPSAFVFNLASRLTSSPDRLLPAERILFTRILKASLTSSEVIRDNARWKNLLILICDKLNDLPTFLYINNPRSQSIQIDLPDRDERSRFISRYHRHFFNAPSAKPLAPTVVEDFVDFSEGFSNYEMRSLVALSLKEKIPLCDPATGASNIKRISEMYKYGVTISEWDKIETSKLENAEAEIRSRIKGQGAAVARVLDIVKRAKIGLAAGDSSKLGRPRGVLFFAGPTGVGKTEMAKALAELLFGDERRLIRFDMSEYSTPQSDQRLLGAPPGYVGYEEGGQLTNAVKRNPFSILLFDEIEKGHGSIFDKFLQILDDGRLTDGKGDTVYFSESIIIFTSNLGSVSRTETVEGTTQVLVTPDMAYTSMRDIILQEIRNHFNFVLGRPEILNRFGDNFVVFDFIKPPVDEEIVDLLTSKLVKAAQEKKQIDLVLDKAVREKLVALGRTRLQHGGRGVRNMVDHALINPLSRALFDQEVEPGSTVRLLELVDKGEDATARFLLKISVKPPAPDEGQITNDKLQMTKDEG